VTKSRLRNLALPMGLAAAAAILIGIYVVSYRNSVTHGAALVKVVVATRDIPAGTDGSTIAGGGYLKSQTVPRRSVVPGSITTAASLTSKVTATEIFKGEQITLRQFVPIAQGGIFSKFSGTQRLVVVPGDPNQLLSGTVSDGDHIDVIVTSKYKVNDLARTIARDTLRNILVLKAPDGSKPTASVGGPPVTTATLVMTDRQAQKMAWALKFGAFMFILRPTDKPRDNSPSIDTFYSVFGQGLPNASHQLLGDFPESIDAQP
jgi:Flp pilus assembly protein CpaB